MANASGNAVSRRGMAWLAGALVVALSAGCASTDWTRIGGAKLPPVCQVVATWQNTVLFTPDPTHNGKMSPGLAGRLYLFGPEVSHPLVGDGGLVVELFDDSKPEPEFLDRWEIDPTTLNRLAKQDMIGWGYTVYLPWTKTNPDVSKLSKVKLRLRYQPAKGTALYTENVVTLSPTNGNINVQHGPPMKLPQGRP